MSEEFLPNGGRFIIFLLMYFALLLFSNYILKWKELGGRLEKLEQLNESPSSVWAAAVGFKVQQRCSFAYLGCNKCLFE